TRRQAIRGAASLVGGTIAVTQLGAFMSRAAVAATSNPAPQFFDNAQFELIEQIVDVMIPETDTPGARTAGVHHFIDMMLDEWASPERRARYIDGLDKMGDQLNELAGDDFVAASPAKKLEALQAVDSEAFTSGSPGNFYVEFKILTLFGYYSSEAGATIELQYEALTPEYKACVPIDDIGRAWFWLGFSHGL
ncbi:MAG: gluconate 2-dehydrogenase subunit 3 family protein, partial [Gammaproteobacteria bacterium]|nr:gluconate 2-dehydrogenase subunit 3 family protein [Gammaproteobacteria bacterium]